MKKASIFLVLVVMLSFSSWSQDFKNKTISAKFRDKKLFEVFMELRIKYSLDFDYEMEQIDGIRISVNFSNVPLEYGLRQIFKDTYLTYEIKDNSRILIIEQTSATLLQNFIYKDIAPTRQSVTISGKIVDRSSGETLPFTSVQVIGTSIGNTSNQDGYFTILKVPTDTSTLIFSYLGYQMLRYQLTPNSEFKQLIIGMEPQGYDLQGVEIIGEKHKLMKVTDEISQVKLNPRQLDALPSLGEKDVFRALQLLPGVSGSNETSSGLYVRGGTPDQNLILFDGFHVYHVDHFYGFFSAFNSAAIKDIQLYKGGFEAKYGGKLSSVVDITGKTGNEKELAGGAGISALSINGSLEVPLKEKGSILLAFRRSYTDIIKSGLYNKIFNLYSEKQPDNEFARGPGRFGQATVEPAFFFYDLNSRITYKPGDKDVLSVSLYNGADNLDNSRDMNSGSFMPAGGPGAGMDNQTTDLLNWGNLGVSGKWSRKWSEKFYSNMVLGYSNYYSNRDRTSNMNINRSDSTEDRRTGTIEDNNLTDITLRTDAEYILGQNHNLEFGAEFTNIQVDYNMIMNDTISILDRQNSGNIMAVYLQDKLKVADRLSFNIGLRTAYYDLTDKYYLEPRVQAQYNITDNLKIKAAWGQYYQFTNRVVREDVTSGSRDFWMLSDGEKIPVGSSQHYIAGIAYETGDYIIDIEGYHKNLEGLTEFSMRFGGPRVRTEASEAFFQGSGFARGLEFMVQKNVGQLTGWLGYTIGEVIHEFPDINNGNPFPALHDQTHEIKVVGNYSIGNWTIGSTLIYATGKPYTAPIGGYELTLLDGNSIDYIHVGGKNAYRLPAYHRLDISGTYHFDFGKSTASAGVSVFNLYGRKNVWYREFYIEDEQLYVTDVSLLGFTPNVFFTIEF